jgi:molybdopterin-containing oxidoreductase family iron-sulfur binding subunit
VWSLYDPDRSGCDEFRKNQYEIVRQCARESVAERRAAQGAGLPLTGTITSPTLAWQIEMLLQKFPQTKWHAYEPIGCDNARAGSRLAFGNYVDSKYRFDRADVILSLDRDFLSCGPGCLRYARDFAARRRPGQTSNRLYVVESTPSITGAIADHRFPLRAHDITTFAYLLGERLGVRAVSSTQEVTPPPAVPWLDVLIRDLQEHKGTSIIVAGDEQPPAVHALVHALNVALGNVENTVLYSDPIEARPVEQLESLKELASDIEQGHVAMLAILGGNPAFTTPADLQFSKLLERVPLRIRLGLYEDETSEVCHWHIPETHYLNRGRCARIRRNGHDPPTPDQSAVPRKTASGFSAFIDPPAQPAYEIHVPLKTRTGADFEAAWQAVRRNGRNGGSNSHRNTRA